MALKISYNDQEKLYKDHLQVVKNIKFTFREIDVIACIIHNRGEKKIANILSIAPKTASAHTHNIMQKLQCNSRENIIDFVESSKKLKLLKQYYFILLIRNNFEKQLMQVAANTKNNKTTIFYKCGDAKEQIEFFNILKDHLSIANIELVTNTKGNNEADEKLKIDDYTNTINSLEQDQYYLEVNNLVSTIFNDDQIKELAKEFNEYYKSIVSSAEKAIIIEQQSLLSKEKFRIYAVAIIALILISTTLYFLLNKDKNSTSEQETTLNIVEIHNKLSSIIDEFSIDNTNKKQLLNNFNLIEQLDNIIAPLEKIRSNGKLYELQISDKELTDFVYIISAVSSYHLFNNYDWQKARSLLMLSNDLIQAYISKRSKAPLNFDTLDYEELHTELSMVQDLPEIYAHTLYFLGRTYIYENNPNKGLKYFYKAEQLGKKLNLFEGYLSIRSGIGIIKLKHIKSLLEKSSNKSIIKQNLLECLEIYKALRGDNNTYILNYKPRDLDQQYVVPSEDAFNLIECNQKIIRCYKHLIEIEKDPSLRNAYAQRVFENFTGKSSLLELAETADMPGRKIAHIYNHLAEIMLKLYDQKIDFTQQQKLITKKLDLQNEDILEIIADIFVLGKKHSRNVDFTKADSYNGLSEVLTRKLKHGDLSPEQKSDLENAILDHKEKRDEINQRLKRNVTYSF